jgi:hypothetical protein
MPTSPIFINDIFSGSYKSRPFFVRQNVTNVVKKWVKKLSVGKIISVGPKWVSLKGSMFTRAGVGQK